MNSNSCNFLQGIRGYREVAIGGKGGRANFSGDLTSMRSTALLRVG